MTLDELKTHIREALTTERKDVAHVTIDDLLLEYIGDEELKTLIDDADLWYS